jgi:succinoglycan biosynthesis transport protein ExoP
VNVLSSIFDLNNKLPEVNSKLPEVAGNSSAAFPGALSGTKLLTPLPLQQIPVVEVQVLPESRIIMHEDPASAAADRFRFLRMCLRDLWTAKKLKSLLITSPLPQDGKSTIALNLATALAERGKRKVVLIEADLHNPTLTTTLGLDNQPGLADCLEANVNPVSVLRRIEPLGCYLLSAGEVRSNPTELLQTEALTDVLQQLSVHFDWVLIDSPPVVPLTDAVLLARQANATLLIAREGRTPREALERSIALIGRQRILGVVLNGMEGLDRLYTGYYGYGAYSRNNGSQANRRVKTANASIVRRTAI